MNESAASPIPAGLLTTIVRFAVLAGALSVLVPYFAGLTATLAVLAVVVWTIARRSGPPAPTVRPGWIVGGAVVAVGWTVALGVPAGWLAVRGPALAAMTVTLWSIARRNDRRGPGP